MADFEEALNSILSNPDAMGQILALAGQLGEPTREEPSPQPKPDPLPDPDPALLGKLLTLFREDTGPDRETLALLTALRPFLRADRQQKLDRALRLAAMSRTARQALRLWKEGEGHV